jgi:hypothetical protein
LEAVASEGGDTFRDVIYWLYLIFSKRDKGDTLLIKQHSINR